MDLEKDLQTAINFINGEKIHNKNYGTVRIFTNYSLKHFKKYNLKDKNVLTRLGSYHEVADLLSYGANVTCYSPNRFDKYFLSLFLAAFNLPYKDNFSYFVSDYGFKVNTFSYDIYKQFRENLSDEVRYFFDQLYMKFKGVQIFNSGIIQKSKYNYQTFYKSVRYFLPEKYEYFTPSKVEFLNVGNKELIDKLCCDNLKFSFINLSYNIDKINRNQFEQIINLIERFSCILSENGKIQLFTTRDNDIIFPEYKRIETRSIEDTETNKNDCKKEYAYMYRKENYIDK